MITFYWMKCQVQKNFEKKTLKKVKWMCIGEHSAKITATQKSVLH